MDRETVNERVRALERLDLEGVRSEWSRLYGEPPSVRSAALLRMLLAWRIQEAGFGGLSAETRRRLRTPAAAKPTRKIELEPGSLLTRDWKGTSHEVRVTDDGFAWRGRSYRSLSAVASAIAGSRWNGRRFFGLDQAQHGGR
jgi:hypothetical protein